MECSNKMVWGYVPKQWLGYTFVHPSLLELALTHSSYSRTNNERLEFLGDSILGMVVGAWLYDRYPDWTEGQLAGQRARIVNNDNLYRQAVRLQVGQRLYMGNSEIQSGGRQKLKILANAVEAIIGAIYLDTPHGLEYAKRFIIGELIKSVVG